MHGVTAMRDLRYAIRIFTKNPAFALGVIATLALGIGANTAIFSAVHRVLLRPMPVEGLERITVLQSDAPGLNLRQFPLNPASAHELNERRDLFEGVGGYRLDELTLNGSGEPQAIRVATTAGDLFAVLKTRPMLGRLYGPDASQPGKNRIAVVSEGFWRRSGGGDSAFLGRRIQISDQSYEVIGVLPAELNYPRSAEIWIPMPSNDPAWRPASVMITIARLRADVELPRIEAALRSYAESWGAPKGWGMTIVTQPFRDYLAGRLRPVLLALMGAVAFVLLLVCANVGGLQLVRATSRTREIAVRTALGAGTVELVRQSLIETLLLSVIGGGLGVLLASVLLDAIRTWRPAGFPEAADLRIDTAVLVFSLVLSLAAGIVLGLIPALRRSGMNVAAALKFSSRSATADRKRHRLLGGFVTAQVSLAFVLLTGAFLMIRSFGQLAATDPGFRTEGVVSMRLILPRTAGASAAALYHELLAGLSSVPGVSAALTSNLPLSDETASTPLRIAGRAQNPDEPQPHAERLVVSRDYFDVTGIRLLRGRLFEQADASPSRRVVLIDAQLAAQYFPDRDPVGQQITHSGPPATIVGVVSGISHRDIGAAPKATVYYYLDQSPKNAMTLVLRSALDAGGAATLVRSTLRQLDASVPISDVQPLSAVVSSVLGPRQFATYVMAAFAALALLLAMLGIYAVISYIGRERTQEWGIRMAIGAQPRDILAFVLRRGGQVVAAGVVAGLGGSLVLTRVLSNLLFGVRPNDPLTLAAVIGLVGIVSAIACAMPALRASRVDPLAALREE